MIRLGAFAQSGLLHLDEIADEGILLQHRAGVPRRDRHQVALDAREVRARTHAPIHT